MPVFHGLALSTAAEAATESSCLRISIEPLIGLCLVRTSALPTAAAGWRSERASAAREAVRNSAAPARCGPRLDQVLPCQNQARRPSKSIPIAKMHRRTRLRTDQTGQRFPAVPPTRHRQGKKRMGDDLHRPTSQNSPDEAGRRDTPRASSIGTQSNG